MLLRIYNYNKISHSNKLQRLNEANLYTFLFITCGLLRLQSSRLYTNIKVSNCSQHSHVVVTCIQWRRQVSEFGGAFEGNMHFGGGGQDRISRNLPSPSLPKFLTPWTFFHTFFRNFFPDISNFPDL